jgi:hypothetical protein
MPSLVTLGTFTFHSTKIDVGPLPRTIGVQANALSLEPVQTVDYIAGYLPVTIAGVFKPPNAEAERALLQAEIAKKTNSLSIIGGASFRVFKNEDFAFNYELHSSITGLIYYSVTLNCLPN